MLKTLATVFATSLGLGGALFFAGPRLTYSGLQVQVPFGTALKVTPDGSNIWTWHHEQTGSGTTEVVVDFDNNGRMDTENPCFRVLITDIQLSWAFFSRASLERLVLRIDQGPVLWNLLDVTSPAGGIDHRTFSTPLPVPTAARLVLEAVNYDSNDVMQVRIIGRLVNL